MVLPHFHAKLNFFQELQFKTEESDEFAKKNMDKPNLYVKFTISHVFHFCR